LDPEQIARRQQILTEFGEFALHSDRLDDVLTEACRLAGEALGTGRAKVLEIQDNGRMLLVRAGVGWGEGIVGRLRLPMDEHFFGTFSIKAGKPVVSRNIHEETRFQVPDFMKKAGVVALVHVPILLPGEQAYGLLQVDSQEPHDFGEEDIGFLRTYGIILGPVIDRLRQVEDLRASEQRFRALVEGVPQLVWRSHDKGQWHWASPQWRAYTGQSPAESRGLGWLEAVHADDRENTMEAWYMAHEHGRLDIAHRLRRVSDGSYRWHRTHSAPQGAASGHGPALPRDWVGTSTDIDDLRHPREQQGVLLNELQHRTQDLLGAIRSVADRTLRRARDLADFRTGFHDRLGALARVQRLRSRPEGHDRVTFDDLIRAELHAQGALDDGTGRVVLEGPPDLRLRSDDVQTLAMALHELAADAARYGALTQPGGHLEVRWRLVSSADGPWLEIVWQESGVVMPSEGDAPQGSGQGREFIEKALPHQLGARTHYQLGPEGLRCVISIPDRSAS
jgi:PAS domain S-box-containing protein